MSGPSGVLGVFLPLGAQTACSSAGELYSNKDGLLRGEVLNPATEPATKVSAICLRASRPVGLFPFLCWSWMRLSNSSLKAWRRRGERETETKHKRMFPSPRSQAG